MIWLVFIVTNFSSFVHTYFYLVSHDNCHYLGLKFVKACNARQPQWAWIPGSACCAGNGMTPPL